MIRSLRLIKRCFHRSAPIRQNPPRVDFDFLKRRQKYDPFFEATVYGARPRTKIGGKYEVVMIKGSAAGPEMMEAVLNVFECANAPVNFLNYDMTPKASDDEFRDLILAIRRCGVCIKGFILPGENDHHHLSRNMRLRNELRLFANVMHLRSLPNLPTKGGKIDVVIVRQNTEGEYAVLEHQPVPGVVEDLKIVTRYRTEYLARFTFDLARRSNRRRVLLAYVQVSTPQLFIDTIVAVSKEYPDIVLKLKSTMNAMTNFMTHPEKEEVVITESMYGGVIANCIFGMIGSAGITAGCNYGNRYAMFESAARSQVRTAAGKGTVNPTAILLASAQMLRYLDVCRKADIIEDAVLTTLECDQVFTPDLGGKATTKDFVHNVIERVREKTRWVTVCSIDEPPDLPKPPSEPPPPYDPSFLDQFYKKKTDQETSCDE